MVNLIFFFFEYTIQTCWMNILNNYTNLHGKSLWELSFIVSGNTTAFLFRKCALAIILLRSCSWHPQCWEQNRRFSDSVTPPSSVHTHTFPVLITIFCRCLFSVQCPVKRCTIVRTYCLLNFSNSLAFCSLWRPPCKAHSRSNSE